MKAQLCPPAKLVFPGIALRRKETVRPNVGGGVSMMEFLGELAPLLPGFKGN